MLKIQKFFWNHNCGITVQTVMMYALFIDVTTQGGMNNYYTLGQENQNLDIRVT